MLNKTRFFVILSYLISFEFFVQTSAVTFICSNADDLVKESEQLSIEFRALTTLYELNKTTVTQEEAIDLTAVYDYGPLSNGRNFEKIKEICEDDFGYDLCAVNTRTKHSETMENFPVLRDVTEVSKPVCFPKSCTDEQVSIVDPNPANCNPLAGNCEILSYETNCPSRNVTGNSTSCELDIIPRSNPMTARLNVLEAAILSSCSIVVAGAQSQSCSLEFGSVSANSYVDMSTKREIELFLSYESTCERSGGQICNADVTADYIIPNGNVGDILLTEVYEQFPLCIPPECSKPEDKQEILIDTFRSYTRTSITAPNCEKAVCDVEIRSVACTPGQPSSAPIMLTPQPTISREPTVTWSPVKRVVKTKPPVATEVSSGVRNPSSKNIMMSVVLIIFAFL